MDYKINFHEPIPQVVERLKQEHDNFELNLEKIEKYIDKNEIKRAIEIIHDISESIIKHSVEEERRIMRIILEKAKEVSLDCVKIMQEHKWVVDFLRHRLQNIEGMIHQKDE